LFIASRIYGYGWLLHPGVLVIALIIAAGTVYPYLQSWYRRKRATADQSRLAAKLTPATTEALPPAIRIGQSLFALFIVGIFAYVVYEAKFGFGALEPRAALFPWVIGLPSLVLALYVFTKDSLQSAREVKLEGAELWNEPKVDPVIARQRAISISCWIFGFFLAIWIFGFVPASALATLLYLKFGAGEKWPITLAISVACWLFFWGTFDYALQMPFPRGAVLEWLPTSVTNLQAALLP
jgi:hypothetical protein